AGLSKVRVNLIPTAQVQVGKGSVATESVNRLLADYYRCSVCPVPLVARGVPNGQPGYFRLGTDDICYGHLSRGSASKSPVGVLEDALTHAGVESQQIELPFDAGEVIENLRHERYTAHFRQEGLFFNEILRKTYYVIRPFLGDPIRRFLQRLYLRDWDKIPFPTWPVDATVDRIHQKLLALSLRAQGLEKIPFIWFWPE